MENITARQIQQESPEPGSVGESKEKIKRKYFSKSGIMIIALVLLTIAGYKFFTFIDRGRESVHYGPTTIIVLRNWGTIFSMYARDNVRRDKHGITDSPYPSLVQHNGLWVPNLHVLYPKYLNDISMVRDPSTVQDDHEIYDNQGYPDVDKAMQLMSQSYVYPGWIMLDVPRFPIFIYDCEMMDVIRSLLNTNSKDFEFEGKGFVRIRKGVERFLVTDISNPDAGAIMRANIPVMIARPRYERYDFYEKSTFWWRYYLRFIVPEKPRRIVIPVLFLDGHVEMMPQDEAPDYIKALVEFLPEPALTSQEFSALMDRRLENEAGSME